MVVLLLLGAGLMTHTVSGQWMAPPAIEWQLGFGGTNSDVLTALQQTSDGGYIFGGYSFSPANGNKTSSNYGDSDFWIVRLDANTNTLWQRSFGGELPDRLSALQQTSDGGYVLGGYSSSPPSGNKTSANHGGWDYWLIRLDANGDKVWEQSFGGSGNDELFSVRETSGGGFILGGRSSSPVSGTKTSTNWGGNDYWAVRVDRNGVQIWDRSYGGSAEDVLKSVRETADGGFVLGGYSASAPGEGKTSPRVSRAQDAWLVRVDAAGNRLWDRSYGYAYAFDTGIVSLDQTRDGGFILAGTYGDSLGYYAFMAVRTDAAGFGLWTNAYWSSAFDYCYTTEALGDGGYMLGGLGSGVYRALRVHENGIALWQQSYVGYGGLGLDELWSLQQTYDGGFILGGRSSSGIGGSKTVPTFGVSDYWNIKLAPEGPRLEISTNQINPEATFRFTLFPGTTNHSYLLDHSTNLANWTALQTNRATTYKIEITDTNTSFRFYRVARML